MFSKINIRSFLIFFADLIFFLLALIITLLLGYGKDFDFSVFEIHLSAFLYLLPLWLAFFALLGGYDLKNLKENLILVKKTVFLALFIFLSASLFFYLFGKFSITPKQNLLNFTLIFCLFLFLTRRGIFYLYCQHFQQKTAILGIDQKSRELASLLKKNPQLGLKFVGFIDKEKLKNLIETKKIPFDNLILAEKISSRTQAENIFFDLIKQKINIFTLAEVYELIFKKIPVEHIDYSWFIENLKEGKKEFYDKAKRVIDIFLAVSILLFSSFLWPLIALAIKIEDGGPVFYKQKRVGKNKKIFVLIKFRSMICGAEKNNPCWAKEDDPRITRVGKFLRRTHLDELPQMINVLKGEISLIGPRPERPEFVKILEKKIPYYHLRHIIKPGFTGWAQIKFRYARSLAESLEKFEYDLFYIKNRSFLLDFYILLKTFGLFFKR